MTRTAKSEYRGVDTKNTAILIVDDEKKFLNSISEKIRLKGFEPLLALSGEEAIEIAKKTKIDISIVDQKMPGMDGITTITKLKEIHPEIKTVLLTGHGNEKIKEATEALSSAYFEKEEMGKFWRFVRKVLQSLETSMAAAGMATGGDLENAIDIESPHIKKK